MYRLLAIYNSFRKDVLSVSLYNTERSEGPITSGNRKRDPEVAHGLKGLNKKPEVGVTGV